MNINNAQKAALRVTLNSPGWGVAQEIMAAAVQHLQEEALRSNGTDEQIVGLVKEARGATKFRDTFNSLIESAASIEGS